MPTLGPTYTKGNSYRARAEARQREVRARVLGVEHGRYGHLLSDEAADAGRNFVVPEAFEAARERQLAGKGVAARTFENMLSSQAMCFNVFAPLSSRLELAARVLEPFIAGLEAVSAIHIEYTPAGDVFGDQTGRGGVDCDVLVEARTDAGPTVQVIETKFVEPEFSKCGFRKPARAEKQQPVCPDDVPVRTDRDACLYQSNKRYAYWRRTDQYGLLRDDALPPAGCPFAGPRWQLWVNLALAHTEADRRGASDARFAVCTSERNNALLRNGEVLDGFRTLLRDPDSVRSIDLDALLDRVREVAPADMAAWVEGLRGRYGGI